MFFFGQACAFRRADQRSSSGSRRYRTCRSRAGDGMVPAANEGNAESDGDVADGIRNRRRVAPCEEQRYRLGGCLRDDEGAGVTCGAERAAVDHYLIEVRNSELLSLAAAPLILYDNIGAD